MSIRVRIAKWGGRGKINHHRRMARMALGASMAAALGLCSLGLSPTASSAASSPATTTVSVGLYGQLSGYWPLWAAISQGYLKKQNLNLSLTYISSDSNLAAAAISGSVGVIAEEPQILFFANQSGGNLKMFCSMQTTPLYSLVSGPSITSIAGLKGKSIGVSNTTTGADAFVAAAVLGSAGLNVGSYNLVTVGGGEAARIAAVQSGAIAATFLNAPYNTEGVAAGLVDLGETTKSVPHLQWAGLAATSTWLNSNKSVAKGLCKSISEGEKFIENPANKSQALNDLATGTGLTSTVAAEQISGVNSALMSTFSTNGAMVPAGFTEWAKLLGVSDNYLTNIITTEFIPAIPPVASRITGEAVPSKQVEMHVYGSSFVGRPKFKSSAAGTTVSVKTVSSKVLTLLVKSPAGTRAGVYSMTITFAKGEVAKLKYKVS